MVKSYFRYTPRWCFGTANSNKSNCIIDENSGLIYLPAGEFVMRFNPKTAEIEDKIFFKEKKSYVSQIELGQSPTGNLLAIGYEDGDLGLFYLKDLEEEDEGLESRSEILSETESSITAINFSQTGDLLAVGSKSNSIIVWDTVSHSPKCKFIGHSAPISCLKILKIDDSDFVVSGSLDGCIRVNS